eukprot:scaffold5356_cov116-Skeletonema_marinoi.AAC.4
MPCYFSGPPHLKKVRHESTCRSDVTYKVPASKATKVNNWGKGNGTWSGTDVTVFSLKYRL